MDLDTLLSTVADRPRKRGYGIGTKAAYWSDLEHCYKGGYCPSKLFKNAPTADEYQRRLKQAERELVWSDPGQTIEKFGSASTAQTPGALADFDCVISSYRKDRDGDRLNPKGADLDPKAPLLWQHLPFEPVGKLCSGGLSGKIITGHCCIADTELGRDAATLVELGALRISHGFQPDEWEPLDDDDHGKGFLISKYEIMEVSLVSIPSNTDAVITAFSRNKLHHPAVKQWAGTKFTKRVKRFPVALDVTLLTNGQPIASLATDAQTKSCTCTADGAGCRTGHAQTQGAAMELETKRVQGKKDLPKAPREHPWDAGEARKRMESRATKDGKIDFKVFGEGFLVVEGEADKLGSYHFPIADVIDGKLCVVYRACVAAEAALNGARGGTNIEGKDEALKVVREYLKEFGDKPADKDDEGKTMTDLQTKGSYCTSAHMDRMKAAHHLVKAAHRHDDLGDEPRSLLNSARGHLDTAIRGIEGEAGKSATVGEKGHHVPSIYLDIIKSAHHLIKSAHRHKATGDEPRRLLNDAHGHLDTVIKAINAVDEVGRDSDYDEDEDPPGTGEGKRAPDDVDSALDMAMNRAFDGKFVDLQKCQRLYKALGDLLGRRKEAETQKRLNALLGLS